jgi:hypothetical protein
LHFRPPQKAIKKAICASLKVAGSACQAPIAHDCLYFTADLATPICRQVF